jgi:hypothetical protein
MHIQQFYCRFLFLSVGLAGYLSGGRRIEHGAACIKGFSLGQPLCIYLYGHGKSSRAGGDQRLSRHIDHTVLFDLQFCLNFS